MKEAGMAEMSEGFEAMGEQVYVDAEAIGFGPRDAVKQLAKIPKK
jgi:hypothetical protein